MSTRFEDVRFAKDDARRGNGRRGQQVRASFRQIRLLLVLACAISQLVRASIALAQSTPAGEEAPSASANPAPPTPPPNPGEYDWQRRYDELFERQRELESKVRAGAAPIEQAQPEAQTAAPLAGYSERNFFLRDPNDWFVLVPKGRINVDYYGFPSRPSQPPGGIANGPADTRPKDTLFIRRARWGIAGTIAKHVDFRVEAEFANVPSLGQYASLTDASVVINYTPIAQLEAGQFYAPFTLENPTSENYTDFMEKSAPVRFAVPTARETGVMVLGESPQKVLRYWGGVFDGEGQNYKNLDYGAAVIGRAIFAPLALIPGHADWLENVWIGGSGWYQKTENLGGTSAASTTGATQGDLSNVTTQAGLTVFSSNYANGTDSANNTIRSHLAPNGSVAKYAVELNVPLFDRVGVRAEYNYQSIEVSEYSDTNAGRTPGAPGTFTGSGGYAEVYAWLGQLVNVDKPGLYQTPHWNGYRKPGPPTVGVMLAAKYEHVGFDVRGLAPAMQGGKVITDAAVGAYSLDVFELGGSLWFTRHSRFIANYVLNYIGNTENAAPAEQKNLFFRKTDHELLFRLAVSL
jgi:hypothetical protein